MRRRLIHVYAFDGRSAAAVPRRLVHFYVFKRTLSWQRLLSFLRLQANALLLRSNGVCFHFYDFNGRSVAAVQRHLVHLYDIAFI